MAVMLTNATVMDIIMNFLALVVISDFDDFFFYAVSEEPLSKLVTDEELQIYKDGDPRMLEDLTKIEITTSSAARFKNEQNLLSAPGEEVENQPEYICLEWRDRKWSNLLAFGVYRFLRWIYVSLWFYYLPFIVIPLSYFVPYAY